MRRIPQMASEIVEAFDKLRRDRPDRPLIYVPAQQLVITAQNIADAARRMTAALEHLAIDPDGVIISAVGNTPLLFWLLLACRSRGQAVLAFDHAGTSAEIDNSVNEFSATAIVAPETYAVAGIAGHPIGGGAAIIPLDHRPSDDRYRGAAVLKQTSGSTGAPRATFTSETALVSDGRRLVDAMDIGPNDTQIAAIPLAHSYGLGNLVMPLLLNGTAISLRDAFVPQRIADDARSVGARHLPGAPFMFAHWLKHPPAGGWPPTLTRLISAGAPLDPDTAEAFRRQFGIKVRPFYGTSETGGIAFDDSADLAQPGFVGRTLPGVSIQLLPEAGSTGLGRVHVRSSAVSSGYIKDRANESFTDGGFLTGDLATLDVSGGLTLRGRVSSFVNIAGRKVDPDEVAAVLRDFPGVLEAAVIGVADQRRGEQLVACLAIAGPRPAILALRAYCAGRLAAHKIPRVFVFTDRLPRTARGKVDAPALRDLIEQARSAGGML
ncbi:MAG: class I adenylate-forming enzyme family protein [Vicinamibacterales bacterium]